MRFESAKSEGFRQQFETGGLGQSPRARIEAEKMRRALDQWKAPGRPDPELWQQMFPSAYAGKSPRVDE